MTEHRKSSLRGALRAYAAEERSALEVDDVTAEELESFLEGSLGEEVRQRIEHRIALDPDLAAEVLERRRARLAENRDEDWRALMARVDAGSTEDAANNPVRSDVAHPVRTDIGPSRRQPQNRLVVTLAAGWLITTVGLGILLGRRAGDTQGGTGELASRQPAIETQVLVATLRPDTLLRAVGPGVPTLQIHTGTERITLVLLSEEIPSSRPYSVTLRDRDDKVLATEKGLLASPDGSFSLSLDPQFLHIGLHTLQLTADEENAEPDARYQLFIEHTDPQ